jgi:hypothetical protein
MGLVLLLAASHAAAQDVSGPRAAVDQLFLGMRMGNATLLRQVFAPDVRFAVLDESGGSAQIAAQGLDGFIRSVEVSGGAWNEQIYDVEVRVDDRVASVWAPYTFYLNERVSHCGVNSIELLRDADGWKITQISDTRRTEGCPDPLGR